MISIAPTIAASGRAHPRVSGAQGAETSEFALAIASLLPGAAADAPPIPGDPADGESGGERQDLAGNGSDVPDERKDDASDAALAWFPMPVEPILLPAPEAPGPATVYGSTRVSGGAVRGVTEAAQPVSPAEPALASAPASAPIILPAALEGLEPTPVSIPTMLDGEPRPLMARPSPESVMQAVSDPVAISPATLDSEPASRGALPAAASASSSAPRTQPFPATPILSQRQVPSERAAVQPVAAAPVPVAPPAPGAMRPGQAQTASQPVPPEALPAQAPPQAAPTPAIALAPLETATVPRVAPIAETSPPPEAQAASARERRVDPSIAVQATRAPTAMASMTEPPVRLAPEPAVFAAFSDALRPASRHRASIEPAPVSLPQKLDAAQPLVAPTATADRPTLDTGRQDWLNGMIDHIETLRDSAGAPRETRIRLSPDALGNVDVSLRHDGDRIHVHFTPETAAARTLLADAAPRLTDLAETRGLRLGQASVDAGTTGSGGQRRDAQPQPLFGRAPARAADRTEPETDQRIA